MTDFRRNFRTGLGYGIGYAAVYSAFVAVLALVGGTGLFTAGGTSVARVVLAYLAAGLGGGCVVGLLLPLVGTKTGAALLGFLGAIPVFWAVGMATGMPQPAVTVLLQDALPLAAILGVPAGLILRSQFGEQSQGPRSKGRSGRRS